MILRSTQSSLKTVFPMPVFLQDSFIKKIVLRTTGNRLLIQSQNFHPSVNQENISSKNYYMKFLRARKPGTLAIFLALLVSTSTASAQAPASNNSGGCQSRQPDSEQTWAEKESIAIRLLSNSFPALTALADSIKACAPVHIEFSANQTNQYRQLQVPALSQNPASFELVFTGNNAIVPLLNDGLLKPLDELIEKYATALPDRLKVRVDGKTVAIALLANAQHLYVRKDLLDEAGLHIPETVNDLIHACNVLQKRGTRYPYAAAYKAGWDLGLEFVNYYLAAGGALTDANGLITLNQSVAADVLSTMAELADCMTPDYLSRGINEVQAAWQGGEHAMAFLWGSRANAILASDTTLPEVKKATTLTGAPTYKASDGSSKMVASTLWWVGFGIPANVDPALEEAAFRLILDYAVPEILNSHQDKAVWLVDGYKANRFATGTNTVINQRAPAYPSSATINLLHEAAGEEIPRYLKNGSSSDETIEAIQQSYEAKALAAGFIRR